MCITLYIKCYYKELACVIMEAETSHNLTSASWRTRKASESESFTHSSSVILSANTSESFTHSSSLSPKALESGELIA